MNSTSKHTPGLWILLCFIILILSPVAFSADAYDAKDLLNTKMVTEAQISPNGQWIAYTASVPREPTADPGRTYSELYLVAVQNGEVRPFITGEKRVTKIAWAPDGSRIAFLMKDGKDAKTQVWAIPANGGEAQQISHSETNVAEFRWHPSGTKIAYVAETPKTEREEALKKKGYEFVFFEENLKHRNLYSISAELNNEESQAEQLTEGVTVWTFEFSPDGQTIAAAITEKNLVDYRYMFQRIHLLDVQSKTLKQLTHNSGKLENFAFSPDGMHLAYAAALERKDHAVSQAFVISVEGGEAKNLTIPDFRGHVNWVAWKDNRTLLYRAEEGVHTTLNTVKITGDERKTILTSKDNGVIFEPPSCTDDFRHFAFVGETPDIPDEAYHWQPGQKMRRLTTNNPWLEEKELGRQEKISYLARDSVEIEGLLMYPVGYQQGTSYPLVVLVHGGPESHYSNGWITRYSVPGQVLAGKGYGVFYPNYRSSTGYGVEFAAAGYGDPAGTEFDDIADGIDYLIAQGIADSNRVGLGGGSYGGYASAWFATYYTEKVNAVCMFVGISDLISKRGTSDIPYEMLYVHLGKKLDDMWDLSLKRSPIYWAHQSQTAVLILGGTDDPRVDPSQSKELYRRLKMNDHPAVRLVQYPGEKHGNREQPGQIDFLYRILDWYDWYVKDARPLDGPMPPLDISEKYGLDLPQDEAEATN